MDKVYEPEEAAAFLMERFRPYLPENERLELGRLVEEMMLNYGWDWMATALESTRE